MLVLPRIGDKIEDKTEAKPSTNAIERVLQHERSTVLERSNGPRMSYDSLYRQFADWGGEDFLSPHKPHFVNQRFAKEDQFYQRRTNGTMRQLPPGCPSAMVAVAAQVNSARMHTPKRSMAASAHGARPAGGKVVDSSVIRQFGRVVRARNLASIKAYLETYPSLVDIRVTPLPEPATPADDAAAAQDAADGRTKRSRPAGSKQRGGRAPPASPVRKRKEEAQGPEQERTAHQGDDRPKWKVFELAAAMGDLESVQLLVKLCRVPLERRDPEGFLPLHRAVLLNHYELFDYLVRRSALVDQNDADGFPTVALVVREARGLSRHRMIDCVLRSGCAVDKPDREGRTALHHAVIRKDRFCAEQLLRYGASPSAVGDDGVSVLLLALRSQDLDIVSLVVNQRLSVLDERYNGDVQCGVVHVAVLLKNAQLVNLLLDFQPDLVERVDTRGDTAAHYAVTFPTKKCLKTLVERGVPLEAQNQECLTVLQLAAVRNEVQMCALLRRYGARPVLDRVGDDTAHKIKELGHLGYKHTNHACYRPVVPTCAQFLFRTGAFRNVLKARREAMINYEHDVHADHEVSVQKHQHLLAKGGPRGPVVASPVRRNNSADASSPAARRLLRESYSLSAPTAPF